jgi:hypothetical protein
LIFALFIADLRVRGWLALDAGFTRRMRGSRVAQRDGEGVASLHLGSGVALLRPVDVVFAAILTTGGIGR